MNRVTRTELMPGVNLTSVQTKKFKSCALGAQWLLPLCAETASLNALVPMVLRRGTAEHPNMERLSAALDDLYGGSLEPVNRKKGETQCIGFVGSFLDDSYTLNGESILDASVRLLAELLLSPCTVNGIFDDDYTRQEKSNLTDRIRSQINDKRFYATMRLIAGMCSAEPYGVDKLGTVESVSAITPEFLWEHYQRIVKTAPIELYYCGSADLEKVQSVFRNALSALPSDHDRVAPGRPAAYPAPETPKNIIESLDVTQGKLSIGLRTGGIDQWDASYPALLLCNAVFGGTATSKLFLNVREKLSLCYYASSQLEKSKGIMLVSSGVEFDKVEHAKAEILAQLDNCRQGNFDDQELESARGSMINSYRSIMDAQGRLEDYWLGQAVAGLSETPSEFCERLRHVTRNEVAEVARKLQVDTVYFLKGKEG